MNYNSRLQELGGEDIAKVDFAKDIRGRKVQNANADEIGTIEDLLFDVQSRKVRYAIVQLQSPAYRKILAPIGSLKFTQSETIEIAQLNATLLDHLPDYVKDEVNPGVENMIRLAYTDADGNQDGTLTGHPEIIDGDNFYTHTLFNINNLFRDHETEGSPKTVKAVFDDGLEAETALSELLAAGFSTDDVELSSAAASQETLNEKIDTPQIANGGSVLSIKITNTSDALKASEILNKNGSINVFE